MHARWAIALVASTLAVGPAAAAPKAAKLAKAKDTPLPGFGGLVYRTVAQPDGCLKQLRVVRQTRKGDDAALVKLLTWPRITGLDFPTDDAPRRQANMKRFDGWFRGLTELGRQVTERQVALARDPARTAVARVEAAARLVVAQQQLVDLIGSIDVPPSIRAVADAPEAFCDSMFEHSEPLQIQVTQARGACQRLITDGNVGPGWWNEVCRMPPTPAPAPATATPPTPPAP